MFIYCLCLNGENISLLIPQTFRQPFISKEKGSGIGLSLSRRIVNLHGGSIQLTSRSGDGTSVTIRLPGMGV
jgi:signal transduction histidine kinase